MLHLEKNLEVQSDPAGQLGLNNNDELQLVLMGSDLMLQRRHSGGTWVDWGKECTVTITGKHPISAVDHGFTIVSQIDRGEVKFRGSLEELLVASSTGGGTWMADEGP